MAPEVDPVVTLSKFAVIVGLFSYEEADDDTKYRLLELESRTLGPLEEEDNTETTSEKFLDEL